MFIRMGFLGPQKTGPKNNLQKWPKHLQFARSKGICCGNLCPEAFLVKLARDRKHGSLTPNGGGLAGEISFFQGNLGDGEILFRLARNHLQTSVVLLVSLGWRLVAKKMFIGCFP